MLMHCAQSLHSEMKMQHAGQRNASIFQTSLSSGASRAHDGHANHSYLAQLATAGKHSCAKWSLHSE